MPVLARRPQVGRHHRGRVIRVHHGALGQGPHRRGGLPAEGRRRLPAHQVRAGVRRARRWAQGPHLDLLGHEPAPKRRKVLGLGQGAAGLRVARGAGLGRAAVPHADPRLQVHDLPADKVPRRGQGDKVGLDRALLGQLVLGLLRPGYGGRGLQDGAAAVAPAARRVRHLVLCWGEGVE